MGFHCMDMNNVMLANYWIEIFIEENGAVN